MRDKRHWLVEIIVIALLLGAFAVWKLDLIDRFVGADPSSAPAEVSPPKGVDLPTPAPVRRLAGAAEPRSADPTKVLAAVQPLLDREVLGPRFSVLIQNQSDGATLLRRGVPDFIPASTLKLQTGTASLAALGEMTTFSTTVKYDANTGTLTLVGGGDPYLASTAKADQEAYPVGGNLAQLARQVAQKLTEQGVQRPLLRIDDSLFKGPEISPAWKPNYVPDSVVTPITALWADQARQGYRFAADPALQAGQKFRKQLARVGVEVRGPIKRSRAAADAVEVGSVASAPVAEIVQEMLAISDNQAAEVLARQVGLKISKDPSFSGGARAVQQVLRNLGVDTSGNTTYDGSGLSRENLITADSLAQTLRAASSADHPELRSTITGVPVAGFTGSLKFRFDTGPADALGRVRAKTGTLTGVHGLSGVTADADGSQMVFVLVADRVAPDKGGLALQQLDRIAGVLAACSCGVGSPS